MSNLGVFHPIYKQVYTGPSCTVYVTCPWSSKTSHVTKTQGPDVHSKRTSANSAWGQDEKNQWDFLVY